MVIKFYCGCGKKVSIPDDKRDMVGSCPSCGEEISLKKADPSAIEREPLLSVNIDKTDPKDATVKIRERKKPAVEKETDEIDSEEFSDPGTDEMETGGGKLRELASEMNEEDETSEIRYSVGESKLAGNMQEQFDEEKGTDELGEAVSSDDGGTDVLDEEDEEPSVDRKAGTEDLFEWKPARLRLKDKKGEDIYYELKKKNSIGRSKDADICLIGAGVSRNHCRIDWDAGEYMIKDGGSRNGVRVNRKKIEKHVLMRGDLIQLGDLELHFME